MKTEKENVFETIVVDAAGCVLGRVASFAAKKSLLGRKVVVLNCAEAIITGRKADILYTYNRMRHLGGSSLNGPNFPRPSEKIMKRTIRGMLSYKQQRGADALKRVICYSAVPKEYENVKKINLIREIRTKSIKVADVSKAI